MVTIALTVDISEIASNPLKSPATFSPNSALAVNEPTARTPFISESGVA